MSTREKQTPTSKKKRKKKKQQKKKENNNNSLPFCVADSTSPSLLSLLLFAAFPLCYFTRSLHFLIHLT